MKLYLYCILFVKFLHLFLNFNNQIMKRKTVFPIIVLGLLSLASCVKNDSVKQGPSGIAHKEGDNYDRTDILSIAKRVNQLNPTHCPDAGKIISIKDHVNFPIPFWPMPISVPVTITGHQGYRIEGPQPGTYQCPMANYICDIIRIQIGGKVTVADDPNNPKSSTHEEEWEDVELLKQGDVIVRTDGDPSYFEKSYIKQVGDNVYRVVAN
jgi:hypothetical protein